MVDPATGGGAAQVDDTDVAIITALQEDGRRPFTEIARSLGLSEGTVRQRVGRLQRLGIVQIVGVINPSRLGMRRLVIGGRCGGNRSQALRRRSVSSQRSTTSR